MKSREKSMTSSMRRDVSQRPHLGTGVQLSWLKNATMLLSTEAPSQLIPVNLVTRPSLNLRPGTSDRHGPNELPDDDDAIVIDAEITEPDHLMSTSTSGKS